MDAEQMLVGKLFHTRGPATTKLCMLSTAWVLETRLHCQQNEGTTVPSDHHSCGRHAVICQIWRRSLRRHLYTIVTNFSVI